MGETHQFLQIPTHLHHEVIEFRLEILLNAVAEQGGEPPEHGDRVPVREPQLLQVLDSRDELRFDRAGEQGGPSADVFDADGALEEVEGGAELPLDAAGQEAGAAVDDVAEVGGLDADLAEEEGGGGDHGGGGGGGQELRAHGENAAEVLHGDAEGEKEIDGGSDLGEGGGDQRRMRV